MTIDHQSNGADDKRLPATPAQAHARRALEHASLFAVDLALARWSGASAVAKPARAAWLINTQHGLQQWLEAGGFAQGDAIAANDPPLYTVLNKMGSNAV